MTELYEMRGDRTKGLVTEWELKVYHRSAAGRVLVMQQTYDDIQTDPNVLTDIDAEILAAVTAYELTLV